MSTYQKAYIYPCQGEAPQFSQGMPVQFNPNEITIQEAIAADTAESDKEGGSLLKRIRGHEIGRQWPSAGVSGKAEQNELTLSVTLFFNTLQSIGDEVYQDVRDYIRPLYPYCNRITAENKGKKRQIRKICFGWGSLVVVGVLTQLSVRYTMFAPDGKPVRAEAGITIKGDYHGEQNTAGRKLPGTGEWKSFGSLDASLALYLDPGNWRSLVNGGMNPRDLLS